MKRTIAIFFILVAAGAGQTIPATSSQIRVLGTAIKGAANEFTPANLAASIDGHSASVDSAVSAADEPLVFTILLDVSGSQIDHQKYEAEAALALFKNLSVGANIGYFGVFNDELYLRRKPATVQSIIAESRDMGRFRGGSALYDAVLEAAKLVSRGAKGNSRRAVFVFTDGNDNASITSLKTAVAQIQRYGIPIFCVELITPKTSPKESANLRRLTESSGGVLLPRQQNAVPSLVELTSNQLWLAISAPIAVDGKLHSINVDSSNENGQLIVAKAILLR